MDLESTLNAKARSALGYSGHLKADSTVRYTDFLTFSASF